MILLTVLAAAVLQAPQASTIPNETPAATAEGIEILRRLVCEGLDRVFAREDGKRSDSFTFSQDGGRAGYVTALWASDDTIQHSRAFHVPGAGVFLALDASLPVVELEAAPKDDAPARGPGDDEWERTRRELRGELVPGTPDVSLGRRFRVVGPGKDFEIDPRAVDKLVDSVLDTVARHGTRVEGLGSQDHYTIALRITGKSRGWIRDLEPDEPAQLFSEADGDPAVEPHGSLSAYILSTAHTVVKPQNLVIRIAVADLAGQPTAERLRQRARISRY